MSHSSPMMQIQPHVFVTQIARVNENSKGYSNSNNRKRVKKALLEPIELKEQFRKNLKRYPAQATSTDIEIARTILNHANESSQSTLLLQKKKEMMEVQTELDRKRQEFNERMKICSEKELELSHKQQNIREEVIKYDKFLKETNAKRQRANRKAAEESKLKEEKDLEKNELMKKLSLLHVQKTKLSEKLNRSSIFEKYLMSVTENGDFVEINDIIQRCDTLKAAGNDVREIININLEIMEKLRSEYANFTKERQNEMLLLQSEIAQKRKELEQNIVHVTNLEQALMSNEDIKREQSRSLGEISMAISNLYTRVKPKLSNEASSIYDKLRVLQQKILDYQDIVSVAANAAILNSNYNNNNNNYYYA